MQPVDLTFETPHLPRMKDFVNRSPGGQKVESRRFVRLQMISPGSYSAEKSGIADARALSNSPNLEAGSIHPPTGLKA